ncbi:MAG: right-handed parallel beta-helix repeat-containing protein [Candidatus Acidiferrales bacterium]
MKKPAWLVVSLGVVLSFCLRPASAQQVQNNHSNKPDIVVDDDKVQCPKAKFTSIQAAVDAANPGDTIRVCAGIYAEQVTVSKALSIRGDNGAIVIPSNVVANGSDIPSGTPVAAVILVNDASSVEIEGLIVDGSNNGISGCAPDFKGILYQNSSGVVHHNAVRHIRLSPSLPGCQSGEAIEVESASGANSAVVVHDNSVWDYQKNGITANETGTQATIDSNTVTGFGPTPFIAQNGIQVAFGAAGFITGNSIADNVYAACVSPSECATNATGVLVIESDGITVANNITGSNQIGIFIGGNNSTVRANTVFNATVLIGVALVGDNNQVRRNDITRSDEAAVYVHGNGNNIQNNEITDAAIGILKISGSSGTTRSGNSFFATPIEFQDPAPAAPIKVVPAH